MQADKPADESGESLEENPACEGNPAEPARVQPAELPESSEASPATWASLPVQAKGTACFPAERPGLPTNLQEPGARMEPKRWASSALGGLGWIEDQALPGKSLLGEEQTRARPGRGELAADDRRPFEQVQGGLAADDLRLFEQAQGGLKADDLRPFELAQGGLVQYSHPLA
jgi:hypothetical protein